MLGRWEQTRKEWNVNFSFLKSLGVEWEAGLLVSTASFSGSFHGEPHCLNSSSSSSCRSESPSYDKVSWCHKQNRNSFSFIAPRWGLLPGELPNNHRVYSKRRNGLFWICIYLLAHTKKKQHFSAGYGCARSQVVSRKYDTPFYLAASIVDIFSCRCLIICIGWLQLT